MCLIPNYHEVVTATSDTHNVLSVRIEKLLESGIESSEEEDEIGGDFCFLFCHLMPNKQGRYICVSYIELTNPLPPSVGAARGPNAKKPAGAGHFAGSPLPPSGRAAGLAAYKRPAVLPPALILPLTTPVKKKKGEEKRRRGEVLPDSDTDFR